LLPAVFVVANFIPNSHRPTRLNWMVKLIGIALCEFAIIQSAVSVRMDEHYEQMLV